MRKPRSPYLRLARVGIIAFFGVWLCLLLSGGIRVGQDFAPATAEEFGSTESGIVSWTPARDARVICRYFMGLEIVEAQRGLSPGQAPGDASCPWFQKLRTR